MLKLFRSGLPSTIRHGSARAEVGGSQASVTPRAGIITDPARDIARMESVMQARSRGQESSRRASQPATQQRHVGANVEGSQPPVAPHQGVVAVPVGERAAASTQQPGATSSREATQGIQQPVAGSSTNPARLAPPLIDGMKIAQHKELSLIMMNGLVKNGMTEELAAARVRQTMNTLHKQTVLDMVGQCMRSGYSPRAVEQVRREGKRL